MNSDDVVRKWAERSGEYSPGYYAYYGPDETSELVRTRLDAAVERDAAVLELGCSSGRHLAHLREHGYRDLHGVDVNDDAFDVMADAYPDLFEAGTFYAETIEDALGDAPDGRFDAVYSVETLQHVPPDRERVFDEVARVADDLLVTAEIESGVNGSAPERENAPEREDAPKRDRVAEQGRADEGDRPTEQERADESENAGGSTTRRDDLDVNFVDDGLPLYYRNWGRVFGRRGFRQVEVRSADRDTFRVFRPA